MRENVKQPPVERPTMDPTEFRELGLLQEINRRFLHPMGLALSVIMDAETGEVLSMGPVLDSRDDPEGMAFYDEELDTEKAARVTALFEAKREARERELDYHVQPIPRVDE